MRRLKMKLMSSKIYLRNVRFHAFHGVLPQEGIVGNDYLVYLVLDYDFSSAMKTDDLQGTINYAEVYQKVREEMAVPSKLLEHVAGRIAHRLFSDFLEIQKLQLSITKVNPPMGADSDGAGVEVVLINDKTYS